MVLGGAQSWLSNAMTRSDDITEWIATLAQCLLTGIQDDAWRNYNKDYIIEKHNDDVIAIVIQN